MIFTSPTISLSRVQDGQSGQPGVSSYVHIKYSDDMATFTANSGETIGKYIGMYTDHIEQDSMTFSDYAWSQLIADDAYTVVMTNESFSFATDINRVPLSSQSASTGFIILHGTDPVTNYTIGTITSPTGITSSVSNNVVTFTVDTTTALTADYGQIMIPITVDGVLITKYASWSVSKKGEQGIQGPAGSTGPQGTSVSNVTPEYRLSDSSTELTGSGTGYSWSPTKPDIPSGKYLWTRNANTLSDGTTVYSNAVCDVVTSGLVFDVDKNSNAITSKVWESDITTSINTYDGSTAQAIRDRVTQTESNITGITSRVSDVETTTDGLGTRMTTAESNITQNANNITTKVSKDGVISSINQSAETIKISASKVNIEGAVTFSSFDSTLQNRLTTVESDASTANTNASSAVSTANTASNNASSALTKVNNSIKSTIMHYLATSASSGITTSTSGWTTTIQSITEDKPYLWTYQTITKIDDTTSNTDPVISGVYGATGGKGDTGTGVTKVEQLYRTSNSTTAPAAPTSTVSSTSTSYNTWTLAMPTYNTSYPYYYICTQTTYDDGTVKWTTVSRSKALEDANSTANAANTNASNAVSTANTANTNASNAVSTANQAKSKADSAASLLSTWTGDATLATTTINGGYIKTHTIESTHLATNAIMSSNYQASPNAQSPYSAVGTFLDLSTGSLYMPQFGVDGTTGAAYFNGQVNADSGKFGDNNSYWNIETVIDYNATSHAALVGTGNPYLQTGNWQISDNAVATRKYVSTSETAGTASYYKDTGTNTFYDVGMKIPTSFTKGSTDSNVDRYNRAFFYQRRYTGSTAPALDSSWDYPFIVDNDGRVYCTDLIIIGGGSGTTYLPLAGGTITGNLSVNGSFTTNLMLRTNLGSTSASYLTGNAQAIVDHGVTGTLGIGNGGTGKTTWTANGIVYASASNALSQLGTGTSGQLLKSNGNAAPGWVNQSTIAAGSATNDSDGNAINTTYRKLSDDTFDTIDVTELNAGELIVTGVGRFSNGLYGNLSGTATNVSNSLKIQLNGGTTEGTNQFTFNGSAGKTVNITRSSIGLGTAADKNVDTSISAGSTSANLPTSAAVATFVEGKGYVTSSGVTSVRVQATSPVVSSVNTAQSSTLNTTISLADAYGDTKNPYGTKTANYVLAGPSSGNAAAPSFRALVAADIPSLTKSKISDFPTTWALSSVTGADDLKAIEALTGTSGMLKKTAANTWALTTVISGISLSDDVFTITKSDGTTETMTVNVTGQIVSGATILTDANGQALAVGSASKPVYFSNGVPVEGNVIPTITINGGASTAASFYAPTGAGTSGQYLKSNGSGAPTWATFSKSTVGLGNVDNTADTNKNVLTATKFASAQSVTLTGDTTGTASSQAGWSIATTTSLFTGTQETDAALTTSPGTGKIRYSYNVSNPTGIFSRTDNSNAIITLNRHSGNYASQIGFSSNGNIYYRSFDGVALNNTTAWRTMLDSDNYTSYTVTKTGSGASGTWGISISGNAASASSVAWSNVSSKPIELASFSGSLSTNGWKALGGRSYGSKVTVSYNNGGAAWNSAKYSASILFGASDTKGMVDISHSTPIVSFAGGAADGGTDNDPQWYFKLSGTTATTYNLDGFMPKSGGTFTGAVTGTSFAASSYLSANSDNSGTAGGLALHGTSPAAFGIAMRNTSNGGKHGYVQGDWAIYSYMSGSNGSDTAGSDNRGWILKNATRNITVASVSGAGNAVFNGSVTVGGNAANTSGCRLEFDDTLKCLDFLIS